MRIFLLTVSYSSQALLVSCVKDVLATLPSSCSLDLLVKVVPQPLPAQSFLPAIATALAPLLGKLIQWTSYTSYVDISVSDSAIRR